MMKSDKYLWFVIVRACGGEEARVGKYETGGDSYVMQRSMTVLSNCWKFAKNDETNIDIVF